MSARGYAHHSVRPQLFSLKFMLSASFSIAPDLDLTFLTIALDLAVSVIACTRRGSIKRNYL